VTSKRALAAFAAVLALSGCGSGAWSGAGATEPPVSTVAVTIETATASIGQIDGESVKRADSSSATEATRAVALPTDVEPVVATTSTTAAEVAGPETTTTTHVETIDLGSVQDAMDDLDALFGAFESQIGSIDLEEGETP
jgi:hypothetical protein